MWRAGLKLGVLGLGGAAAVAAASSEDAPMPLKICALLPLRLLRDSLTAASIAFGLHPSSHYISLNLNLNLNPNPNPSLILILFRLPVLVLGCGTRQ